MWELSLERWEATLRANLTATFLTARGFLREVERTGHGNLVLVGSTAGRFGEAGHADYAAAKSAIQVGLLLSLKNEIVRIAPLGRVNAVAPGWTYSPMTRGSLDPDVVERVTRTMPLRKVASADDIARASSCSHPTSSPVTSRRARHGRGRHGRPHAAPDVEKRRRLAAPPRTQPQERLPSVPAEFCPVSARNLDLSREQAGSTAYEG